MAYILSLLPLLSYQLLSAVRAKYIGSILLEYVRHLLQSLDLTSNTSVKKMEKRGFSDYFTSTITETLEKDPHRDVTTIEVDLKLSTLKPIKAKLLMSIHEFLQGEKGRKIILNGWKAAGITEAVESAERGAFQPWTHLCPSLYGYLVFFAGNKEQILLLDVVVF